MIDWHTRFLQQADWTRSLRDYLFERCGLDGARRILEVGCGTGTILAELGSRSFAVHGIDHDPLRLLDARRHAAQARLLCGDALALPYANHVFDMTFCHFLLLWVGDPLQALREMSRVTRPGGHVLALAEPDYLHRIDRPAELASLGNWQTTSLRRQGADPGLGLRLAGLFRQAGIELVETGQLQMQTTLSSGGHLEWAVLAADLSGQVPDEDLDHWKAVDERARAQGQRVLHIPTYFAFGRLGRT